MRLLREKRKESLGATVFENVIDFFAKGEGEPNFIVEHSITTPTVIALGVAGLTLIAANKVIKNYF